MSVNAAMELEHVMEKFQRHNQLAGTDRESVGKESDDQYTAHSSPHGGSFQEDSPKPESDDGDRMMTSPTTAASSGGKSVSENDSDGRDHNEEMSAAKASQSALIAQQIQLAAAFAQRTSGGDGSITPSLSSFMPQAMMSQFHHFHNGFDPSQLQHVC